MVIATVVLAVGIASVASTEVTGKGLLDHGISAVANQDCKMMRTLQGKDICQDQPQGTVTVQPAPVKYNTVTNYEQILKQRQQQLKTKLDK